MRCRDGFENKYSKLSLYTQTIFEKGRGDSSNTNKRDELVGLNILVRDRLLGISWENQEKLWIQKILIEGKYTKNQGNFLCELTYSLNPKINVTSAFGLDQGDLSKNKSGKLAVEWMIR